MGRWYLSCTAVAGAPAHVGVICKVTAPVPSGFASPGPLSPLPMPPRHQRMSLLSTTTTFGGSPSTQPLSAT